MFCSCGKKISPRAKTCLLCRPREPYRCSPEKREKLRIIALERGYSSWLIGRKLSKEHKRKISIGAKKAGSGKWMRGRSMPLEVRQKISQTNRITNSAARFPRMYGALNNRWKGGITPIVQQIRHCLQYKTWRRRIMERDNYTCRICRVRGGDLEVDHFPVLFSEIFSKHKIQSLEDAIKCYMFWDISNGQTLCKKCHNQTKKCQKQLLIPMGIK